MIKSLLVLVCCFVALSLSALQGSTQPQAATKDPECEKAAADAKGSQSATPASPGDLKNVLAQLNNAAQTFKAAKANFQWDQYECVVRDTSVQKGEVYFRRTKTGMDAAVRVTSPDNKQVVFTDGTLKLYQPLIKQLTVYDAKAKRTEVESLMNIGFGSHSDDILNSYEVKMEAWETVDGVKTARLNLVPKNEKLKASITNIILWVDPQRDISLKQMFMEGQNFRFTHYTDIEINGKISNNVFELKTPAGTTTVRP